MVPGDEDGEPRGDSTPPTLRHRLEYVALRAFAGVVRVLGLGVGYALAKPVGSAIHLVDRRHREIARENIRQRLRDADGRPLPEPVVRRIARDSFRHLVTCAVEVVHLPRETASRGLGDIVVVRGREHFEGALASGRGVILATAHMGNWEVMGAMCREFGVPFTTVYRPLDNPLLDRWVRTTRVAAGQTMIPKEGALRPLLKALRGGGMVVLLVDQVPRRGGIPSPFFGALASTVPTPAELALRTGAVLLTGTSVRVGPGFRFEGTFDPPVDVQASEDHAADLARITAEVNARIEAGVRRAPEQWLWAHRRWKTRA